MKQLLPLSIGFILLLSACDNGNDDQSKTVDKDGSVEVTLSTKHLDSLKDVLTTHYKVWNHGNMVKEFDKTDTLPTLGKMLTDIDKDNGDEPETVSLSRDYEFYVTVK